MRQASKARILIGRESAGRPLAMPISSSDDEPSLWSLFVDFTGTYFFTMLMVLFKVLSVIHDMVIESLPASVSEDVRR